MTIDQEELLDHAREQIRSAEFLLEHGMNEGAVSYAYRAMYTLAQTLLLEHELAFSKHLETIAAFKELFCDNGLVPPELHEFLLECYPYRDEAFPETDVELTVDKSEKYITHARSFIKVTEEMIIR